MIRETAKDLEWSFAKGAAVFSITPATSQLPLVQKAITGIRVGELLHSMIAIYGAMAEGLKVSTELYAAEFNAVLALGSRLLPNFVTLQLTPDADIRNATKVIRSLKQGDFEGADATFRQILRTAGRYLDSINARITVRGIGSRDYYVQY